MYIARLEISLDSWFLVVVVVTVQGCMPHGSTPAVVFIYYQDVFSVWREKKRYRTCFSVHYDEGPNPSASTFATSTMRPGRGSCDKADFRKNINICKVVRRYPAYAMQASSVNLNGNVNR